MTAKDTADQGVEPTTTAEPASGRANGALAAAGEKLHGATSQLRDTAGAARAGAGRAAGSSVGG